MGKTRHLLPTVNIPKGIILFLIFRPCYTVKITAKMSREVIKLPTVVYFISAYGEERTFPTFLQKIILGKLTLISSISFTVSFK